MILAETSSISSSDEIFEDAVDELGPLPERSTIYSQKLNVSSRYQQDANVHENRIEANGQFPSLSVQQVSPTHVNQFISPSLPKDISSSRRSRLYNLRTRMKTEFGGSYSAGLGVADDDGASTSENASLASWGRNLLMEHSTQTMGPFYPADSLSTKASMHIGSRIQREQGHANLIQNSLHDEIFDKIQCATPPPIYPPPPLPPNTVSTSNQAGLTSPAIVPPPLPPRKQMTFLPSALPVSQIITVVESASDSSILGEKSDDDRHGSIKMDTSNNNVLTNSFARIRGHVKTKSLDRGLSLAKTMKTGPFPPSSNKSNSLKREYSTDGSDPSTFFSLDGGEEALRDSDAQGVISQITLSVLNEDSIRERLPQNDVPVNASTDGRLSSVGEETTNDSTSNSNSPSAKPVREIRECSVIQSKSIIKDKKEQQEISLAKDDTDPNIEEKIVLCSEDDDEWKVHQHSEFVDPITRDVERRMSLKGREHAIKSGGSAEDKMNTMSASGGNLEKAAGFMREYGSYASGIFWSTLSKAKKMVTSSGGVTKLTKEEDEYFNENDRDDMQIPESTPIVRPRSTKRGPFDFDGTRLIQELNNEHTGAIWCIKFSLCGRLLATAGQDNIIRIWVLRNHLAYFNSLRDRYKSQSKKNSVSSLTENMLPKTIQDIENDYKSSSSAELGESLDSAESRDGNGAATTNMNLLVMAPKPLCTYRGHTADVLDISWSRNYFMLSSGMDRTVKLWHLSRPECLCCFQHIDFVTCIAFMPKDDRYFLSGSLDGKLRLWHIPEKKVALWNEVEQVKFITAICFVKNGKFAAVGTYDGRCFFYTTDQLKYHTVIDVRSSRGKNSKGHKVTGLAVCGDKLLVTSNDSRIRMYDLRDMALTCKFKGVQNERSQIRASFSPDGRHIICGSEDRYVYVWTTSDLPSSLAVRKDRNDCWQRIQCHSACVTAAIFAPRPQLFLSLLESRRMLEAKRYEKLSKKSSDVRQLIGDVIISADLAGSIKIFANRTKLKAGGSVFFATD